MDIALITALGIGLMIGIVRERTHEGEDAVAGVRTHTLVALSGFLAMQMGVTVFAVALFGLGLLTFASYRVTALQDPGLTGEVALLVNALLAGLTHTEPALAASLGVVVAILLFAKPSLQKISRTWLAEGELNDVLMVAAAAFVVLPLLPVEPLDPWGVVRLDVLWRVVVLIMGIAVLGHWAQRLLGSRWGLPVAGFFSGWVSSTAAVASLGGQARENTCNAQVAAASALLANLASILLLLSVVGATAPALLSSVIASVLVGSVGLVLFAGLLLWQGGQSVPPKAEDNGRAVSLKRAGLMALIILGVSLASAVLDEYLGEGGVLVGAILVALAELHSAAIGIAQLASSGRLEPDDARWFILAMLAASTLAKSALAFIVGGKVYGTSLLLGLAAFLALAAGAMWLGF